MFNKIKTKAGAIILALAAMSGASVLAASPAFAVGALTNVTLDTSNSITGPGTYIGSGAAGVIVSFTEGTTSTAITSITFSVPASTVGASLTVPDSGTMTGLGADTATASLAGTTVTLTITGGGNVTAGTSVSFEVAGFTALPLTADTTTYSTVPAGDTSLTGTLNPTQTDTIALTTATTAALSCVAFTLPTGITVISPTVHAMVGVGTDTASAALSGGSIQVTLTGGASISASTLVAIEVTGIVNQTAANATNTFASTVTTYSSTCTTVVDTGTAANVPFGSNTTAVTATVPESTTFANTAPTISLLVIPGAAAPATGNAVLTVATNAAHGYTLSASETGSNGTSGGLDNGAIASITAAPVPGSAATLATTATTGTWGAIASISNTGVGGCTSTSGTINTAKYTASDYTGYATAGNTVASSAASACGDVVTLANGVQVGSAFSAGVYSGTITYVLTPSY